MKRKFSALMALFLCCAMLFGTFAFAAESPAPSESPAPEEEEAAPPEGAEEVIYGRLDNRGRARSAYAVVAVTAGEPGEIVHHGQYTEVENLTDTSPIEYKNGTVTIDAAEAGRYYYQGKLRKALMPWDIQISYTLDGAEIDPDDLGGASGSLTVDIHTSTNSGFDSYFTDNYMLQISVTLPGEAADEITARNGTIALAGSDKTITFVVLPGAEGDVGFSAEIKDFTMAGFTIAGVPYSAASMMGDMEEVDMITDGLTQLSDGISALAGAAGQLSDGADTLADNGPTLTDASDQIADALNQISSGLQGFDLSSMTGDLSALEALPAGLTEIAAGLETMKNMIASANIPSVSLTDAEKAEITSALTMLGSTPQISADALINKGIQEPMASALADVINAEIAAQVPNISQATQQKLMTLMGSLDSLSSMAGYMSQLTAGLEQAVDALMLIANQVSVGLSSMTDIDTSAITELQTGMAELASQYGQFNEGLKTYTDGVAALADGAGSFSSGMYTLNSETSSIPDILNEFLGEDEEAEETGPVSFLSDENEETASVQFVLSTEGIAAPEDEAPEEPEPEARGFFAELWDKIVALFT